MTTTSQRSSATVDGPRDNVFQREVPSFLEVSKFLRSLGEAKGSSRAKNSSIRLVVSTQHRLVADKWTDGRKDRHTTTAHTMRYEMLL